MLISFYNNLSNHNVVNKELDLVNSLNFEFKDTTSITNPELVIKNYEGGNYCFIEPLGRYYYIDNIRLLMGGFYSIRCSIDVLKTYASEIENSDYYSIDGGLTVVENTIDFDTVYDNTKFLLVIGG